MIQLSKTEFQKLNAVNDRPCISIYMPAEVAGAETRKNPILFKNLIDEAEDKLSQSQDSSAAIKDSLETAKAYIENYDFWQHQDRGLAFFIDTNGINYYRLPYSFERLVVVGDRFHLKPLIPLITRNSQFYLLALSQNQVRWFWGNHYDIKELDLPEAVPASLAEALKYDDPEKQIQYHSGDPGDNPIYHGQGVGTTDNKDEIKRFFQQVARGLQSVLQEENTPLVLAGVEYLLPIYHEVNSYNHLIETGITGNPENIAAEDLHQQAWSIIEPHLEQERQQAINNFYDLSETDKISSQVEEIVAGAFNGRVDTLFLASGTQHWGKFDPQTNQVELHAEPTADSLDLLDFAATHTFLQNGLVHILDLEEMPERAEMAAIFRYPIRGQSNEVATVSG